MYLKADKVEPPQQPKLRYSPVAVAAIKNSLDGEDDVRALVIVSDGPVGKKAGPKPSNPSISLVESYHLVIEAANHGSSMQHALVITRCLSVPCF